MLYILLLLLWMSNAMENSTLLNGDIVKITKPYDARKGMKATVLQRSAGNASVFARVITIGQLFQNTVVELKRGEFVQVPHFKYHLNVGNVVQICDQTSIWPNTTYVIPIEGICKEKLCQVEKALPNGLMTVKVVGSTYHKCTAKFEKLRYVSPELAEQKKNANKQPITARAQPGNNNTQSGSNTARTVPDVGNVFGSFFRDSTDDPFSAFTNTSGNNFGFDNIFNSRNNPSATRSSGYGRGTFNIDDLSGGFFGNQRAQTPNAPRYEGNHTYVHNKSYKLPTDTNPNGELCYDQILNPTFTEYLDTPLELLKANNYEDVEDIYVYPQLSDDNRYPLYNNMYHAFKSDEVDHYYNNKKENPYNRHPLPLQKNQIWKRKLVNKKFFSDYLEALAAQTQRTSSTLITEIQNLKDDLEIARENDQENDQENDKQNIFDQIMAKYSKIHDCLVDVLDSISCDNAPGRDELKQALRKTFKPLLSKTHEESKQFKANFEDSTQIIDTHEVIKDKLDFSLKGPKIENLEPVNNENFLTDEDIKSLAISVSESDEKLDFSVNSSGELNPSTDNQHDSSEELNFSDENNKYSSNSILKY